MPGPYEPGIRGKERRYSESPAMDAESEHVQSPENYTDAVALGKKKGPGTCPRPGLYVISP